MFNLDRFTSGNVDQRKQIVQGFNDLLVRKQILQLDFIDPDVLGDADRQPIMQYLELFERALTILNTIEWFKYKGYVTNASSINDLLAIEGDEEFEELLDQFRHSIRFMVQNSIIDIELDEAGKSIIRHDLIHHTLAYGNGILLFFSETAFNMVRAKARQGGFDESHTLRTTSMEKIIDSMVQFVNYYNVLLRIHNGLEVSSSDIVATLPASTAETYFDTEQFPESSGELLTVIRTLILNAIAEITRPEHDDLDLSNIIAVKVLDQEVSGAALMESLLKEDELEGYEHAEVFAEELPDYEGQLALVVVINQIPKDNINKFMDVFKQYIEDPGDDTAASGGLRLAVNLVSGETATERKLLGVMARAISPADATNGQLEVIVCIPKPSPKE